jgi:hypothetical protein
MRSHSDHQKCEGIVHIVEPWEMTAELLLKLELFRIPPSEFVAPADREKELAYDRQCNHRATYVIYYSKDEQTIIAAARIIAKNTPDEKLPIEWGKITTITDHSKTIPVEMKVGEYFTIQGQSGILPVCEIGGFRAADIDPDKGITMLQRYRAIDTVMHTCSVEVHKRKFHAFFLTCCGSPHMERLYSKYYFIEAADINYEGSTRTWKALWRWPFKTKYLHRLHKTMPISAYIIPGKKRARHIVHHLQAA